MTSKTEGNFCRLYDDDGDAYDLLQMPLETSPDARRRRAFDALRALDAGPSAERMARARRSLSFIADESAYVALDWLELVVFAGRMHQIADAEIAEREGRDLDARVARDFADLLDI